MAEELPVTGPTTPLPAVALRRWPRWLGGLWWLWALVEGCSLSVVSVSLCFLLLPFSRFSWARRATWFVTVWLWGAAVARLVGVRWERHDEAPVPEGACIFACNHQSNVDILVLFPVIRRPFVFVAKKAVFSYPFIGWHLAAQRYISVDRRDRASAIRSLTEAGRRIREEGLSVAIFPEGTRSNDGGILPFKKGPFMTAMFAKVPVVPVAIHGSLEVNPPYSWSVVPNTVRVMFGPAYDMSKVETDEQRDQAMKEIRATMIRMHQRLGGKGGDVHDAIAGPGVEGTANLRDAAADGQPSVSS